MEQSKPNQCEPSAERNSPIVVHAKPHKVNGDVEWSLDFTPEPARGAKVDIKLPKGSGGHTIVIHLVGAPGIRFHAADPIWVVKDGPCPPPAGSSSAQIRVIDCEDKKLVLFDSNDGPACDLTYQLNFDDAEPFDPMIRNGGSV